MSILQQKYYSEIRPRLAKEFRLANLMAAPIIEKVALNIGVGEGKTDKTLLDNVAASLATITGQKPKLCRARKSISAFSLQEGSPIGLMVTLRGKRMYDFLEKLFKIVLPRIRDFQGTLLKSLDKGGNYNLGIPEITVFPEVDFEKLTKVRGLEIALVIKNSDPEKSKRLLEEMGMPFQKQEK